MTATQTATRSDVSPSYRAQARFKTRLRPDRPTTAPRLEEVARQLFGFDPLPWQREAFALIGELFTAEEAAELGVPFGTPAYREILLTVPRQSGKSTVMLASAVERCLFWRGVEDDRLQSVIYTAQTGWDARNKLVEDWVPNFLSPPPPGMIADHFVKASRGVGSVDIKFRDGRIFTGSSAESAGHGQTLHRALLDEVWKDVDDTREQALQPTLVTNDTAQLIVASTAGTAASAYLNRKTRVARQAVEADTGRGLALLEYSADPGADPYDPNVWFDTHPAAGLTQSVTALEASAASMDVAEFRRAFLCIPTAFTVNQKIPAESWAKVCGPHSALDSGGRLQWAFDVSLDRQHAAIAVAAHTDDEILVELVEYNADADVGVDWVRGRLSELVDRYGGHVVFDGAGPGVTVGAELTVPKVKAGGGDYLAACDALFLGVASGRVRVRHSEILDRALADAPTRAVGDRWAWHRAGASDPSPLIAATFAAAPDLDSGGDSAPWVQF